MKAWLYDRLGGFDGISAIVNDVEEHHLVNPLIKTRFANSDIAKLKKSATLFFCAGGGGPEAYTGKDMLAAHRPKNGVGAEERKEVLAILYSLKDQIVRV